MRKWRENEEMGREMKRSERGNEEREEMERDEKMEREQLWG